MGFLKDYFRSAGMVEVPPSQFERLTEDELKTHLRIRRYGSFELTDAVRPSYELQVVPSEGYRHDSYKDPETGSRTPVLMAAVTNTREKLFEVFMSLLDPLGKTVDVVLETSHAGDRNGHTDLYREHIDLPVLKSILWEYEQLLTHDGCAGIAVMNPRIPEEVQFDEHKLLIVYGENLDRYARLLESLRIQCRDDMQFITEAEHVHSSSTENEEAFQRLGTRLGMDQEWQ